MMLRHLALLCFVAFASAIELDPKSFDEVMQGKVAFIMFRAPWCGHCKAMKPDWDALEKDYSASETAVVGHVDCTVHSQFCADHGIKGYPTLKYGDPINLEDYQGQRSLNDLKAFAEKNLVPRCGPKNPDLCDDAQKKLLDEYMAMSAEDVGSQIEKFESQIKDAEESFNNDVKELQEKYKKSMDKKDAAVSEIKNSGLGMLKSVKSYKNTKPKDDL